MTLCVERTCAPSGSETLTRNDCPHFLASRMFGLAKSILDLYHSNHVNLHVNMGGLIVSGEWNANRFVVHSRRVR